LKTLIALLLLAPAVHAEDTLLFSMKKELRRSFEALGKGGKEPLYFLSYQVRDTRTRDLHGVLGAVHSEGARHYRFLDVDARVGSPKFDNTHQLKGREAWVENRGGQSLTEIPVEDDDAAIRSALWLRTDHVYKEAVNRYTKVRTNNEVTAAEDDTSDDFTKEPPARAEGLAPAPEDPGPEWRERIKRLSALLKPYPFVFESYVSLTARSENRYFASSEGTSVVTGERLVRLSYRLGGRTEDGMDLERAKGYDGNSLADLPSEAQVAQDIAQSARELQALVAAPVVEPFSGPAIIVNRAAGVYFHEILGHRLEGHRQKIEEEGQTFTKMLGKPVVAPFVSVVDDPTLERFKGEYLRGYYKFDDEGVPAGKISLIEGGVLKGFLMSRMPIARFPRSNGHGRRSAGYEVVPRMGNLVVSVSNPVPFAALRAKLVEEIKRQKKPYGLIFDDITGGYTATTRNSPQSFKVIPLLVYRVYPDGRPDEPVRGVDIVGTPLTAFSKIIAAGDDPAVFNGTCGAESGWVPVSAVAPSMLISEIEVEKKGKSSEKPPILPPPLHDRMEARK
jgi:TldD protein